MSIERQDIEALYRLTPLQEGMLFHTLEGSQPGMYVEQMTSRAPARIERTRWEDAWNRVLASQPMLRAAVAWEGLAQPMLVIMRSAKARVQVHEIDATADDDEAFARRVERLREEEVARGFDLRQAPMLRQFLLQRSDTSVVFWVYHHILMDGWSAFVVLGEVLAAYGADLAGQEWQPRPSASYQDYLAWRGKQDMAAAQAWWREELRGFAAATPLGLVERSDGDGIRQAAAAVKRRLGHGLAHELREKARSSRCTVGNWVQAAWALTLGAYSSESDVVFGLTVAGRPPELEGTDAMVGLFINTVPCRVRMDGAETGLSLVQRMQRAALQRGMHEHASLSDIAGWSEVPRGNPMFDSMLAIESFPYTEGVSLDDVDVWQQTNFPLTLVLDPVGDMQIRALFDPRRHAGETVARVLDHFCCMLQSLVERAGEPVGLLSMQSASDAALQAGWNHQPFGWDAGAQVGTMFERQAELHADAVAVVAGAESISYRALERASRRWALRLQQGGAKAGEVVAFCFEPCIEMVAVLVGIARLGCAYAPLDPRLPAMRLQQMVAHLGIRSVACSADLTHAFEPLAQGQGLQLLHPEPDDGANVPPLSAQPLAARSLFYVIHTSGSTGLPKAAGVFHDSFARFIQWWNADMALVPGERCLLINKITFDLAQKCVWGALLTGGELHLAQTGHFDPLAAVEWVRDRSIHWINCTPSMAYSMLEVCADPSRDLRSLRSLMLGGEPIDKRRLASWLAAPSCTTRLVNTYGPTECTDLCTVHHFEQREFTDLSRPVTVGRVLPGLAVYVLDRFGNRLPCGVTGDVVIAGGSVGVGYLGNPGMTADRFRPDAWSPEPGGRLYYTGDRGFFNADGTLVVRGRTDFQVKLRGYRIELDAIGHELRGHAQVRDAVVTLTRDGQHLVAYVVAEQGVQWDAPLQDTVREYLRQRLADYMVPSLYVPLAELPLNANGKLDRAALPEPAMGPGAEQRTPPTTETEAALHALWADVLGHAEFGVHDNFFELGGHSLNVSRLYARLHKTFGVRIPLAVLFQQPTVAQQAAALDAARSQPADEQAPAPVILPQERPARVPLSYQQSRLWFLHQFDPSSLGYHVPNAMRFEGEVHVAALQQALDWLHARHETLRTRFPAENGEPWQDIAAPAPVSLRSEDLRSQPAALERLQELALGEAAEPFDLGTGPLARYLLVQTVDGAVLFITLHHIITDGWSMDVLVNELRQAYDAFAAGGQPRLEALPVQYADYAIQMRKDLAQETEHKSLAYWQQALAGSNPQIGLPYDHARPPVHSMAGRLVVTHIDAATASALRTLGHEHGATEFMVWLALFDALLYRCSGQADFNIGTPVANRAHPELEGLIGFFVNTLVLRAQVDGNQDFIALLRQVSGVSTAAFEHQSLPFEFLVDKLNPERHPAYQPLFQVGFAMQRAFEDTTLLDPDHWIARFDLQLILHPEADGGLRAHWEYATALFDHATVVAMADAFEQLARAVAMRPAQPLDSYPLLSAEQEARIVAWETGPQPPLPGCGVHVLVEQQAARAPQAIALESGSIQLSYAQLNDRANRIAHLLIQQGVQRGQAVALCLGREPDLIAGLLAILKAGAAYVPLDPDFPPERLQSMLQDSGAALVLSQACWRDRLPQQAQLIALDGLAEQLQQQPSSNPDVGACGHDPAYVLFTSGSTGRPKGVVISHLAVTRLVCEPNFITVTPQERVLQFANVGFDASTLEIWGGLCNGATLVQAPSGQVMLSALADHLVGARVTTAFLTTSLFHRMVEDHGASLAGLRQLLAGGEAMSPRHAGLALELLKPAQGRLVNGYGPTETTTFATCHQVGADDAQRVSMPIGIPLNHTVCRVLSPAGLRQPIGVEGELYIGGAGVAEGYAGRPDLTQRSFVPDPFGAPGERLYRSGDRVRRRADGVLVYTGRADHQVKLRGYRIELDEIVQALCRHAGAESAHVQPIGEGADKMLVAYVVGGDADQAAMKQTLAQHLPAFMVPAYVIRLPSWPLTANGKLDTRALPTPAAQQQDVEFVPPATEMEQRVAAVWAELLGLERVSVTASFFDLGGNSLTSTRLLAQVRASIGHSITIPVFFANPTVRAMAGHLERVAAGLDVVAEDVPVDGERESDIEIPRRLAPVTSSLEHVLLTGGTGFLGAYLVRDILRQWPGVVLHAHVRATDPVQGLQRLRANLQEYGLWDDAFAARLRVFTGDLGAPRMGLDESAWETLARQVDLIIHNASHLNHVLPYPALKAANVEPTRRLLELGMHHKLKGFMYVSTTGVLRGDGKGRTVDENLHIEDEKQVMAEGYNASKWVAELMVRRAGRAGMPVQIARLGRVVVDSRSGQGRLDDFVALFVRTCLRIGAYPDYPLVEEIVPVDYLGTAIVSLAGDHTHTGVHHLVGAERQDWSSLLPDHVDCEAAGLRKVPVRDWVQLVKEASVTEPLPFAPYLFWWDTDAAAPEEKRLKIRSQKTVRALEGMGVKAPKVSPDAWTNYLERVFQDEKRPFQKRRRWF